MIIGGQSGFFESDRLVFRQHPEGAANFHAKAGNATNHFKNLVKLRAVGSFSPGCAHAHAGDPARSSLASGGDDVFRIQQSMTFDIGIIMGALRAVRTIFWAAAGLDRDELAGLDTIRRVELTMDRGGAEKEICQGQMINRSDFFLSPIVTKRGVCAGFCKSLGQFSWSFSYRLDKTKRESHSRETSYHWLFRFGRISMNNK